MSGPAAIGRPPGTRNRPQPAACSVCAVRDGQGVRVLHFNLVRSVLVSTGTGRDAWRQRGAGSIDLCERCWREATERSAIRRRYARHVPRTRRAGAS